MKKLLIIFLLLAFGVGYLLRSQAVAPGPLAVETNVIIPKGTSLNAMAVSLAEANVISNPLLFKILARFNGIDKKLRAGEYQFPSQISMLKVLDKIARGDVFYRRVTLAEGITNIQIFELLQNIPELSGEITLDFSEGELLPETYTYEYGNSRNSILRQAQRAMTKQLEAAWNERANNLPLKNMNELLILASVIEKETGVPEERGMVASVFVNRLKKGMKLQTDPTVIYAVTQGKEDLGRSLKKKDLDIDSPYNTYKYYGLPPAPICNPGKEALWAAAHPESSDFLYFVATGDGGHNFATSLNQHNQNVRIWVKTLKK